MKQVHEHGGKSSESILDKDVILKALEIHAGQNILDAGCGNGYMAKEFSRLVGSVGKVYAIDIYEQSIKRLKDETAETNIEAMHGDITKNTGIEDSSVDVVYLSTVFHGFTDSQVQGFLPEVKRVLKPGGVLAVIEINKKDTPFGPPANIRYSPEELVKAIDLKSGELTKVGDYFYMQTFVYEN
jgi:ubiquinone/menaquinone biosynthesis C-methylase UbiE